MRRSRQDEPRLRNDAPPIVLLIVQQGFPDNTVLEIIELAAIANLLLEGGNEPSIKLRVARLDLAGQATAIGFAPRMSDQNNHTAQNAEQGNQRQSERRGPADLALQKIQFQAEQSCGRPGAG